MNIRIPLLATLEGKKGRVLSVAFHPTAPLLAIGSENENVTLWQVSPDNSCETCVATLKGHSDWVNSVAFHPTAPILATGSSDTTVRLWLLSSDNSGATCVATLAHYYCVTSVAFHPTAQLLATSGLDIKLWQLSPDNSSATRVANLSHGNRVANPLHGNLVLSVAFHPTAQLLATSGWDTVKLWQLSPDNSSATRVANLAWQSNWATSNWVTSVAFHPTAPLLATGSWDRNVKLWQLSPNNSGATCVATLAHFDCVNSVAFHPTAQLLATGSWDRTVKLWQLSPDNSGATCVATLSHGKCVNLHPPTPTPTPTTRHAAATQQGACHLADAVAFHPTAPLLATGGWDDTVKVWDCRHLTNRVQLATASRGFGATARLLAKRLAHDPSVHPRLLTNTTGSHFKNIVSTTARKSLPHIFAYDVNDRLKQYLSHGARMPSMSSMSGNRLAGSQYPFHLQTKILRLKNGESPKGKDTESTESPKGKDTESTESTKSPKGSNGGSRRRKIKSKNKSVKKNKIH